MSFVLIRKTSEGALYSHSPVIKRTDVGHVQKSVELLDALEELKADLANRMESEWESEKAKLVVKISEQSNAQLAARVAELETRYASETTALHEKAGVLAVEIVRRIASECAMADAVAAIAEKTARDLSPNDPVVFLIHPDAEKTVRKRLSKMPLEYAIETDASLDEDACILETPRGKIDASLSTQLTALEDAFLQGAQPDVNSGLHAP